MGYPISRRKTVCFLYSYFFFGRRVKMGEWLRTFLGVFSSLSGDKSRIKVQKNLVCPKGMVLGSSRLLSRPSKFTGLLNLQIKWPLWNIFTCLHCVWHSTTPRNNSEQRQKVSLRDAPGVTLRSKTHFKAPWWTPHGCKQVRSGWRWAYRLSMMLLSGCVPRGRRWPIHTSAVGGHPACIAQSP